MERNMARREEDRLAELPGGRWVFVGDLDYTPSEAVRVLLAWLVVALFLFAVALAGSAS